MKRLFCAAVFSVAAVGVSFASSDVNDVREECATTRDVQMVIVNLRDHGWTSQRIADSVLEVSKVQDEDTRRWFLDLIRQAYERRITPLDIETDFQRCVSELPPVMSRLRM